MKVEWGHGKATGTQGRVSDEVAAPSRNGTLSLHHRNGTIPLQGSKQRLERFMDIVVRRRWMMLVTFLIVAGMFGTYGIVREPVYETASIVRVELKTSQSRTEEYGAQVAERTPFATNERPLMAELFFLRTSGAVHQRVMQRLQQLEAEAPDAEHFPPRGRVEYAVADNAASSLLVIGASVDPQEAMYLANLYAEEYVRLTQEASRAHLTATRELLEVQKARRQDELDEADARLEAFKKQEGAVELDQETQILASQIASLEVQRDDARLELQTRRAALRSLQQDLEAGNDQLTSRIASDTEQRLRVLQDELVTLRANRDRTAQRYPDPEMRDERVQARLEQLTQQIEKAQTEADQLAQQIIDQGFALVGGTGTGAALARAAELRREVQEEQRTILALENKLDDVERRLAKYNAELRMIPEQSRQVAQLERDRQRAERALQSVESRLQDTRIAEESEPGYAHVLRMAGVPREPAVGFWRILMLGIFFGIASSFGVALLRDKLDKRLYKPEQLREQGHHVIGVIPNMQSLIEEDHGGAAYATADDQHVATSLVTRLNSMSTVAEAYRQLRTNIQHRRTGRITQILLVTSPGVGEGKSTIAANLAIAAAQAGRRTLLLDADLRRPQVHKLFGLEVHQPGLVEMLHGHTPLGTHVAVPSVAGVHVVPAWNFEAHTGEVTSNPVGLLESPRLKAYLAEMRDHYDTILIDTPPILAATDAIVLSTQCDAALVVIRAGKTKEDEMSYTVEALEDVGARIIGLVFNAFDVSMAYGHVYKYQHYTRYGPYSKYGYYGI